jgi:cytochrome c-type biogenesis protein CcmF
LHDVYITIGEQQTSGGWIVNVQLNYYTRWIWVAAVIMTLGILLSMRKKKYV